MEEENDLKSLKSHIEEFVNKYNIKYIGIDIEEEQEMDYGSTSTYKDIKINLEY